jgi:dipeptidase E
MKLILASDLSSLLKYGYALTSMPKEEMNIGYVTTASNVEQTQSFFIDIKNKIKESGYKFEEIDITGKAQDELLDFFEDKNVIHVEGGNTFHLLKIIREVGFDDILKNLLSNGKIYIGTSAGAYIMCPTIEVANWNEDGKDRFGVTDFTALNYVPFILKVHYTDEQEKKVKEKSVLSKYPLRILRDGQGIVVEDDKCTFVGGEEVIIK